MPIIRDSEVEFHQTAPGTKIRQLVNQEIGAGAITVGEVIMEPGSSLPLHTHKMEEAILSAITRRDATICPRAVPVADAMIAIAICDHLILWKGLDTITGLLREEEGH